MADNTSSSDAGVPASESAIPDAILANVIERDDAPLDPESTAQGRERATTFDGLDVATLDALAARRRRDTEAARARLEANARGWDREPDPVGVQRDSHADPRSADGAREGDTPDSDDRWHVAGVLNDPPELVKKRYLRAGHQYFLKDAPHHLAFEDWGVRLVTGHNRADIVESMLEMAGAKGWHRIRVSGHEEFRREAWLQASLRGIEARGYEPKTVDWARLDELRKYRMNNRIEPEAASQQQRRAQGESHASAYASADATDPTREAQKEERGYEPPAQQRALRPSPQHDPLDGVQPVNSTGREILDGEPQARENVRVGPLLDHGSAPYQHDPENSDSYYAVIGNRSGTDHIVWGVDLARAIDEGGARIGDMVSLENLGKRWVTIEAPVRDETGKVVDIEEQEAYRNTWQIDVLERRKTEQRDAPSMQDHEAGVDIEQTDFQRPSRRKRSSSRNRDMNTAMPGQPVAGTRTLPPPDKTLHLAVIVEAMRLQGFSEKSAAKVQARAERMLDTLQSQGVVVPAPKVYDPKAPAARTRATRTSEPGRTRDIERAPAMPDPSMPGL